MTEPALRKLDRDMPRVEMRNPALAARQRERLREIAVPPSLADIKREKVAALEAIRTEAAAILDEARAEAASIIAVAVVDARQQIAAMLHDAAQQRQPATMETSEYRLVADIQRATAQRYGVSVRHMLGPSKSKNLVRARFEAIAEAYLERPDLSLPVLGRLFGGRDHTTILHALRRMGVYQGRGG